MEMMMMIVPSLNCSHLETQRPEKIVTKALQVKSQVLGLKLGLEEFWRRVEQGSQSDDAGIAICHLWAAAALCTQITAGPNQVCPYVALPGCPSQCAAHPAVSGS